MRRYSKLCLLIPAALACSDSTPTGIKPSFAEACNPPKPSVSNPPPVTRLKNQQYTTIFAVNNKCTVGMVLQFTAGRTGAVASIVSVSPTSKALAAGTGVKVFVAHKTGSPGTGTLTLTATTDPGETRTGVQQVTVTN